MMLRAKPGCCEEAALGVPGGGYIPCNKPAANVIGWKGRPDAPILMCEACTDHNVRNRGGEVVTPLGCSCPKCKAECRRVPGWFTPEEAMRAIKAGMAKRLTVVHQADVAAVAPACSGMEGHESHYGEGRCTFLTNAGLCEIHDSGFKQIGRAHV